MTETPDFKRSNGANVVDGENAEALPLAPSLRLGRSAAERAAQRRSPPLSSLAPLLRF